MIQSYKLFTTPTCPSCPAVKAHMQSLPLPGELVDATTPDGAIDAGKHGIMTVPTVIFYDSVGSVIDLAQSIKQVNRVIEKHGSRD